MFYFHVQRVALNKLLLLFSQSFSSFFKHTSQRSQYSHSILHKVMSKATDFLKTLHEGISDYYQDQKRYKVSADEVERELYSFFKTATDEIVIAYEFIQKEAAEVRALPPVPPMEER